MFSRFARRASLVVRGLCAGCFECYKPAVALNRIPARLQAWIDARNRPATVYSIEDRAALERRKKAERREQRQAQRENES